MHPNPLKRFSFCSSSSFPSLFISFSSPPPPTSSYISPLSPPPPSSRPIIYKSLIENKQLSSSLKTGKMKGKVQYIDGGERGRGRGEGNQRWMGEGMGETIKLLELKFFFQWKLCQCELWMQTTSITDLTPSTNRLTLLVMISCHTYSMHTIWRSFWLEDTPFIATGIRSIFQRF